jgi:Transglutaminase-like superfamily
MRRGSVRSAVAVALLLSLSAFAGEPPKAAANLSLAITAPRPIDGEWMGVYLMDKKVGFYFTNVKFAAGKKDVVEATNEFVFIAQVGNNTSERVLKDVRTYEAKPKGKLLTFRVEQKGDGGDQILEGTATAKGMKVVRRRPNMADEVLEIPASKEVVEDADQARVAIASGKPVVGTVTDGMDLEQYEVKTTLGPTETRLIGGVQAKLKKAITISAKEKVPTEVFLDEQGRVLEVVFGATMKLRAEPEASARKMDKIEEVFSLTRVVLPRPLPNEARQVPGEVKLVVNQLGPQFRKKTERQSFKDLPDGRVEVTISSALPKAKKQKRPLVDPLGGENLKSTLSVEAKHPDVQALMKSIVGPETDAWATAVKISSWVGKNLIKDYGASSDRATDVIRKRRGDCTEHSLLTVSLLRAAGIPARRVDGVVYLMNDDKVPALYWHEWVEAWVGEWMQLDPTFGQDVADATHFAVGEEGNAEITPLIGSLKVLEVR